jgi:hypothetical protein
VLVRTIIACIVVAASAAGSPAFPLEADGPDTWRTAGLIRAHWDYPAQASVGFGVIVAKMPSSFDCRTPCHFNGVTFQGSAGIGGGELAVGYGSLVGETGREDWLIRRSFIGYGVRAAAVRTWGTSTPDSEGDTFLGVEGAMAVAQFGLRLGVFHGENDWRVFGGLGWGF